MNEEPHIVIGERHGWGDLQPFGISPADRRQHLYIIGKTGSGKTTLLRNLIVQHIAQGDGVGLIDPHGDFAEEILNHIPPSRADHVCYFNPGDLDFPIGLNLLANVAPGGLAVLVNVANAERIGVILFAVSISPCGCRWIHASCE